MLKIQWRFPDRVILRAGHALSDAWSFHFHRMLELRRHFSGFSYSLYPWKVVPTNCRLSQMKERRQLSVRQLHHDSRGERVNLQEVSCFKLYTPLYS